MSKRHRRIAIGTSVVVRRKCIYCQQWVEVDWENIKDQPKDESVVCTQCLKDLGLDEEEGKKPKTIGIKEYLYVKWPKRLWWTCQAEEGAEPTTVTEESILLTEVVSDTPATVVVDGDYSEFLGV